MTTAHARRPADDVDDDVRPRRPPAPLGRPPERHRRHPAGDRRLHRVRAAAVRAPVQPDLPGRRRSPGPTVRDNRAVHAMARIMLHGLIDHIQCSWVKLGPDVCTQVLNGGVNDLGGTLMEETISRMAGSTNGSRRRPPSSSRWRGSPAARPGSAPRSTDRSRSVAMSPSPERFAAIVPIRSWTTGNRVSAWMTASAQSLARAFALDVVEVLQESPDIARVLVVRPTTTFEPPWTASTWLRPRPEPGRCRRPGL